MTKQQIKEIAENLDCGFKCYIHIDTRDIKFIPDRDKYFDMDTEPWEKEIEAIDNNFGDYIEISGMDSRELFKVMADFVDTVDNKRIWEKLVHALERPKPFRNFKFAIDNSGEYRIKWFKFKGEKLENWVNDQLRYHALL
jgi:hypothetical protein